MQNKNTYLVVKKNIIVEIILYINIDTKKYSKITKTILLNT